MKVLSISQPWAGWIAAGVKPIENRTWNTSYRGPIAIHAAATIRPIEAPIPPGVQRPRRQKLGGIIAVGVLRDVVTRSESPWFCGPYGLVITDVVEVEFVPLRGYPKLYALPEGVALCPKACPRT